MYSTILVPIDGSAGAAEALDHGIDIARHYDATVHLVYVVDEGIYGHYGGIDAIEHAEEAMENAGQKYLEAARDRVESAELPVAVHIEHALPHEGIVSIARRVAADLIVMGTERRSGEYRRMLGSVSERVIHLSPVPIHLVKVEPTDETTFAVRDATDADEASIRDVARRSMEASYAPILEVSTIASAVDRWYGGEELSDLLSDPATVILVAEKDGEVIGFSQSHIVDTPAETTGEIHWLHVDPDYRDEGVGSELLERTRSTLTSKDVDQITGHVLADHDTGIRFYETRGFERIGTRTVSIADEPRVERVYAAIGAGDDAQTGTHATAGGETVFIDYGESEIGSAGPFFAVYTTRDLEDRYGWYCSNCGTVDTAMDPMGRIVCNQCGNHHKATRWDAVATE